MSKIKVQLTSVKLIEDLYKRFKSNIVNESMTFQKLVNRSLFLYVGDDKYRDSINDESSLTVSGSNF